MREMKKAFQFAFVFCMGCLLLAPAAMKMVHTFYAHHDHHFCMEEAKGEIHFHVVEYDCHFQPLFVAPYYFVVDHIPFNERTDWVDQPTLSEHGYFAILFQQTPFLRGPPHA